MTLSLEALLAPLSPDEFFRDYYGKKHLHIKGGAEKFRTVCDWATVSGFLSQAGIWTTNSLELALEGKKVETQDYCVPGLDRDNRPNQLVDLARVKRHLQQGASLVLNDVTTLATGIQQVAHTLAEALQAKVQANLYCSWKSYQGFSTHFDVHDVFAVHLEGRKTWNIYGKHFDNPIPHPKFRGLGSAFHKAHHGPITETVTLEPGDLLYIPRGWYHDALAKSEATMHIAFGTTGLIGLDALTQLFEAGVEDADFRADLPLTEADLPAALAKLGEKINKIMADPAFWQRIKQIQGGHRTLLGEISLPGAAVATYSKRAANIALLQKGGHWHLGTTEKSVPLPPGAEPAVRWIIQQEQFVEADFATHQPSYAEASRRQLLADLVAMKVLQIS